MVAKEWPLCQRQTANRAGFRGSRDTAMMRTMADDNGKPEAPLAPMDFSTFVLSLGSTAMVNLGQVPAPGTDAASKNLPAAKQMIDILGVLQEKTKGNLTEAEQQLIDSLLYDLRVHWVDAQ